MPFAESEVVWSKEPKLGLFERLYLPIVSDGLTTTIGHILFGEDAGRNSNDVTWNRSQNLPPNYRGVARPA